MKISILCILALACAILIAGCIEYIPNDQMPTPTPSVPLQNLTTAATPVPTATATAYATPTQEPYPYALKIMGRFVFGSEEVRSIATVYRYRIFNQYTWHNDQMGSDYTQQPSPGNKYLFIFLNIENIGRTRVYAPKEVSMSVIWNGQTMHTDQNRNPVLIIREMETLKTFNGGGVVRDYGMKEKDLIDSDFIYPGGSNARDGYLIYEVPKALNPEQTIIAISFNSNDTGYWVLRAA